MSECIITLMGLLFLFMMYAFIMKPLNRRYEALLNHRLGKEIARRLYGEIDPIVKRSKRARGLCIAFLMKKDYSNAHKMNCQIT